jgi:hypothetical protein
VTTSDRWSELLELLRARQYEVTARLEAADELVKASPERAKEVLLAVARDEDEDERVTRKVGRLLGRIYFDEGTLDDVPLHDFTTEAYLGFDDQVADLQRGQA